jgi:hypothetical protein
MKWYRKLKSIQGRRHRPIQRPEEKNLSLKMVMGYALAADLDEAEAKAVVTAPEEAGAEVVGVVAVDVDRSAE